VAALPLLIGCNSEGFREQAVTLPLDMTGSAARDGGSYNALPRSELAKESVQPDVDLKSCNVLSHSKKGRAVLRYLSYKDNSPAL
jgi:hypothetical protein